MKRYLLGLGLIALTACNDDNKTAGVATTTGPDSAAGVIQTEEAWVAVDSATEMKAFMEYATPGEQHKVLAALDGNWDGATTMWMSEKGAPMTSTATMTNKMIMGGRFQQSSFKGDFMGQPFEGMSLEGYDNSKKKFVSTWIDNMGTGLMNFEGDLSADGKVIESAGTFKNPATGKMCNMRQKMTITDANNAVMEMWGPDSQTGKMYKTMEIKLTRKK